MDYLDLQKAILTRLRDGLVSGEPVENLLNLVDTAIDYGFYLKDESGTDLEKIVLDIEPTQTTKEGE